nr:hypothetical protein BaRGS_029264 [Batillaria attramentaria]
MNIKKALEKVIEWQSAAAQLKPHLPSGDAVLTSWYRSLQDFRKDLPVLYKLANDALKERHWQTIFLGMNEPHIGSTTFTVAELMSFNLSDNADLVHRVYLSAVAEYDLEQQMSRIKRVWQDKNFKLAKHIPDSMFAKDPVKRVGTPGKRATKLERYRQERAAAAAGQTRGLDVANDDFYVLIELEELKYQLEDSRISVDAMLQSPYVGDIKTEAEEWSNALREIEELTDLWVIAQKKWLYLLKIFERPEMYRKLSQQAYKFEALHNKFKDWMRVVSNDSKVLSVVNRRRGEKGYRLLQGDNLRSLFLSLIQQQEEILKDLEGYLDRHRAQFPRLYFLSNTDLVDMVGISRNPQGLVPFVRKCFPGVNSLTFTLPPGIGGLNSALDVALNSDKLQVVSVHGAHKEELALYTQLDAQPLASTWLRSLDSILKNTMTIVLQACVQARMDEGTRQPILILEELARAGVQSREGVAELAEQIHHKYRHWLLHFPAQCVQVAECILWERSMVRTLEKTDADEMEMLRSNVSAKVDQYVDVLREASVNTAIEQEVRQRLSCLLSSLINQNIHHRDVMDVLLKEGALLDTSFDWLRVLKFRMDIRNVLRAKTTVSDAAKQAATSAKASQRKAPPGSKLKQEPPHLTRTKTTVSTDYQYSPCYVQQLAGTFFYDYEYLGPSTNLVVTPLTERATLSLTQSLKTFHCSTLIENITLPIMLQYMTGMVQSGCWVLFDDTDHLTKGLMSVTAQQLDYLHTALRALDVSSQNQYLIRGQPRFDKEKGLVTYFEDTWVAEREQRRHSIEREIEIKESDLYKNNRPPPLFYEHVKANRRRMAPDYTKLIPEPTYMHRLLGNIMFNGKLIPASANFGCFMTTGMSGASPVEIPDNFRLLMRPCALIKPDTRHILSVYLQTYGFQHHALWAQKLSLFLDLMEIQFMKGQDHAAVGSSQLGRDRQSGSGKSTCCHILSRAINLLNYKLFAPDHSNDELTTDRNVVFQSQQKLKLLRGIDEDLKPKASTGLKKLRQMKTNLTMAKNIQVAAEETRSKTRPANTPEVAEYPKVDVLLGQFKDGLWEGGLLGKIAQDSFFMWLANRTFIESLQSAEKKEKKHINDIPSMLLRWLVLDGDLDPAWTDGMKTLFDGEQRLSLANGEGVQLKGTTSRGMTADGVASRQMASRLTNSSQIEAFIPHYIDIIKGMFAFAYEITESSHGRDAGPWFGAGQQPQQRHLFFIDDLNMAPRVGGYQPPVELLRHVLCAGGTYDRQRQVFQEMQEASFIATATLPTAPGTGLGHATQVLSSRVLRQFVNLTVFAPSRDVLLSTFSRPIQTWLEEFPHLLSGASL